MDLNSGTQGPLNSKILAVPFESLFFTAKPRTPHLSSPQTRPLPLFQVCWLRYHSPHCNSPVTFPCSRPHQSLCSRPRFPSVTLVTVPGILLLRRLIQALGIWDLWYPGICTSVPSPALSLAHHFLLSLSLRMYSSLNPYKLFRFSHVSMQRLSQCGPTSPTFSLCAFNISRLVPFNSPRPAPASEL